MRAISSADMSLRAVYFLQMGERRVSMSETQGGPTDRSINSDSSPNQGRALEALRRERDELQEKLDQIAQVIGAPNSDRILHDVRNVMNELVLLRSLSDLE